MLNLTPLTTSKDAAKYFAKDNYYTQESTVENSAWYGQGASILGLSQAIDPGQFENYLHGRIGGEQLGRVTQKGVEHRPGWDLTFSAPKSVSILSEVYGIEGVRHAHDRAVKSTLSYIEKTLIQSRITQQGKTQKVDTGNAVFALFTHDVSRELDPNLHTHSILINATRTAVGWRSIHADKLFQAQQSNALGMFYRAKLASELREQGYGLVYEKQDPTLFELSGVPDTLIRRFSTRADQIEQYFKAKDWDYNAAYAKQVALLTRKQKEVVDRNELLRIWRERANDCPIDVEALKLTASNNSNDIADALEPSLSTNSTPGLDTTSTKALSAEQHVDSEVLAAVHRAMNHLSEREQGFSEKSIVDHTQRLHDNKIDNLAIQAVIDTLKRQGVLVEGRRHRDNQHEVLWTTPLAKLQESLLIESIQLNRGVFDAMVDGGVADKYLKKTHLNEQQKNAIRKVLASTDRLFAIQGDPGVGKTTTLNALKTVLTKQGHEVVGLAPTYQAVSELSDSLKIAGFTVDRFLVDEKARKPKSRLRQQVWIIDESSMLSVDKMQQMIALAETHRARLIFVGDHQQLESVDAGRAFNILQEGGVDKTIIDKRLRQKTEIMKAVVADVLEDRYEAAIQKLHAQGNVAEFGEGRNKAKNEEKAMRAMVDDWFARDETSRKQTLLATPTNEQRQKVNALIRDGLRERGILDGRDQAHRLFEDKYLSEQEKRLVVSYDAGDVVRFSRDLPRTDKKTNDAIARNEYFTVVGKNAETNTLALRSQKDQRLIFVDPAKRGANIQGGLQVFIEQDVPLAKGDKVRWRDNKNQAGLTRNTEATVVRVGSDFIRLETTNGKRVKLDLKDTRNRHFEHDYAKTVYALQGKTEKEVLVLAQSWRINTTNQRSMMVSLSRAENNAIIYTDSAASLAKTLRRKSGDSTDALTDPEFREQKIKTTQKQSVKASRSLL